MKGNNTSPLFPRTLSAWTRTGLTALFTATALLLCALPGRASVFLGNGSSGFTGAIGNGSLNLTDNGTDISGTLTVGGNMGDVLVIYIQTGAGGSFADTSGFSDAQDGLRKAVSGWSGSARSLMTFATGFSPNYAVALGPQSDSFGGIFGLVNGGNNSLNYLGSATLAPTGTGTGPFTFSIPGSAIGLAPGVRTNILIFGTYISNTGYRSSEALAGNDTGTQGWSPFAQTAFGTYTFDAGAATSYPITFTVDMSQQITSGAFVPANGDTVYAAGTFEASPFSGSLLTVTADPNIYTGTFQDANPVGTAEAYKFKFHSVTGNSDVFEDSENRPFTQQAGPQSLPQVYFADLAPAPGTNFLTFHIDLTPWMQLGHFDPSSNVVEVLGTFETPAKWVEGFVLTNNPNGANTNLYSGTYPDGNYPGSWEQYKFVISNTVDLTLSYESGNNRTFATPAGAFTFPVAYFNNITNVLSIPVTFSVDVSSQVYAKTVNLANGDTVQVGGFYQNPGPYPPLVLTNNPSGANTNLFSGTFIVEGQPGTLEQYKFIIVTNVANGGGTLYESPVSTGNNNRGFTLAASAQTLPTVFWSDLNPREVLPVDTLVTFNVDMSGALDLYGYPFDPNNDSLVVNGDFLNPAWPGDSFWKDQNPPADWPNQVLSESPPNSQHWHSLSQLVPAGHSLKIEYKYGIAHQIFAVGGNTNADNEAGFAQNHVRYIRAYGSYSMPLDIFGIQRTNQAAAIEPPFAMLPLPQPSGGHILVTWLGGPGIYLQTQTSLGGPWEDHPETAGLSATNWPFAGTTRYFRLIKP